MYMGDSSLRDSKKTNISPIINIKNEERIIGIEFIGPTIQVPGKLEDSAVFYTGGLMVWSPAGYLSPTGGGIPAGVLVGFGGSTGELGTMIVAPGLHPDAVILKGYAWVPYPSAHQSDIGKIFYIRDDSHLSLEAGGNKHGLACESVRIDESVLLNFFSIH